MSLQLWSELVFDARNRWDPCSATLAGISATDHLLPDLSAGAGKLWASRFAELHSLRPGTEPLDENARVDRDVVTWLARSYSEQAHYAPWASSASAIVHASPLATAFEALDIVAPTSTTERQAYRQRLEGIPDLVLQYGELLDAAVGAGQSSTLVGLTQVIKMVDSRSAAIGSGEWARRAGISARSLTSRSILAAALSALSRLKELVEGHLLRSGRQDDEVGMLAVSGGVDAYRSALRCHTTVEATWAELHEMGRSAVEAGRVELEHLGRAALGVSSVNEIRPSLLSAAPRFSTSVQMLTLVRDAIASAVQRRHDVLGEVDIEDCLVDLLAPGSILGVAPASYVPGRIDGGRRGIVQLRASAPTHGSLFEYEAIAFHEGEPGHHLQSTVARGLSHLSALRRSLDTDMSAFVEGWALYAESLADDVGLYSAPTTRLGMLSLRQLRMCRLVIDTGMHGAGWGRAQSLLFMLEHTLLSPPEAAAEVDRCVVWPGQGSAYAVGYLEIRRHRELFRRRSGGSADLASFHRALLAQGAVPLGVVGGIVDRCSAS